MNDVQEERAKKLVQDLEDAGNSCGLLLSQGTVIMRSPGAPWTDTPMLFNDQDDLNNALELGLLKKTSMISIEVGSSSVQPWEWYVIQ